MIIKPVDDKYLGSVASYDVRLVSYDVITEQSKNVTLNYTKQQIEICTPMDAHGVTFTLEEIQELVDILRRHAIVTDPAPEPPISPDSPA